MNIPILKELERLKNAHATAKVKSTAFQPDEKDQKELIYQNVLRKEENKRRVEEKLREADAKMKEAELRKADASKMDEVERKSPDRPQTAPVLSSNNRAKSFKISLQDDSIRPLTSETGLFGEKHYPFDAVLKSTTVNFGDELKHHVEDQSKDSRRIFESLLHHYKGGGVACHFRAKRPFEVVDINAIVAAQNFSNTRGSGGMKLEDFSHLKKKDGIALIFDPTTNTGCTSITMRIYFQRAIDLVTEESCSRDYVFHSDGNYFGLELADESCSSSKASGDDRSPRQFSPGQLSPSDGPSPSAPLSPSGSPSSVMSRKMGGMSGGTGSAKSASFSPQLARTNTSEMKVGYRRSLPGWQGRGPIFIPSTRCSLEILHVDGAPATDASTAYNLSKLRLFGVAAASGRAALKKVHEFCHEFFVTHTANLVVAGGISALNLAALHGNLEVRFAFT